MMLCFEIFMFFEFSTSVRTEWVIGISGINEYVKKSHLELFTQKVTTKPPSVYNGSLNCQDFLQSIENH